MEDSHLGILQMMENAGRNPADTVLWMIRSSSGKVTILVGAVTCVASGARTIVGELVSGPDAVF